MKYICKRKDNFDGTMDYSIHDHRGSEIERFTSKPEEAIARAKKHNLKAISAAGLRNL